MMSSSFRSARQAASLAVMGLVCLVGCGGPYEATMRGKVTLDGEPISSGMVTFNATGGDGISAYAKVNESGDYRVKTGQEFGLNAGEYVVTIVAREKTDALYGANGGPPPAGKLLTPQWYRSPSTSGLSVSVESGKNNYDLELTSEPPEGWEAQPKKRRRR